MSTKGCHTGARRYPGKLDPSMNSGSPLQACGDKLRRNDVTLPQLRHTSELCAAAKGSARDPGLSRRSLQARRFPLLKYQNGISFVELIMFIIIVGVAVTGVLLTLSTTAKASADPLLQKQALSVAESLLDEIALRPITLCDPDGPDPDGPAGPLPCAIAEGMGPEAGETRYSATAPFDNVNDYNGFSMTPIVDAENNAVAGLANYTAAVTATNATVASVAAGDALLVTVRVTGPGNNPDISVSGVRIRYAADPP